ncbi:hypothetical protein CEXT_651881 [Caerostris extrusa]|uniref:Uncharacterized protein n=1 Tax=Caerostris extrusa TaxID=172846 RepID=A0AAV4X6H9_CAEEX|nr:hypothetical protein CEXT_651881 [Caerostris extrusa]
MASNDMPQENPSSHPLIQLKSFPFFSFKVLVESRNSNAIESFLSLSFVPNPISLITSRDEVAVSLCYSSGQLRAFDLDPLH